MPEDNKLIKRTYIVYGAFDRHNYGDLLFAVIAERYIFSKVRDSTRILIASSQRSDLSKFGALKTSGIGEILASLRKEKEKSDVRLIVAGGEVLTARWEDILGYIGNSFYFYAMRLIAKVLGGRAFARIASKLNGIEAELPFVPRSPLNGTIPVFYNAVGGSELLSINSEFKEYVQESLTKSPYVSVRDDTTLKSVLSLGVNGVISPDSAMIMSELFPSNFLKDLVSPRLLEMIDKNVPYIVFQISEYHSRGRIEKIVNELNEIIEKMKVNICLLSIGKASGHSDDIPLDKINERLTDKSFRVASGNIYEIMYVIAHARVYCGTSLHGAITSMSYGVPHIGLLPKNVPKLKNFLESWSLKEFYACVDENSICQNVIKLMGVDTAQQVLFSKHIVELKKQVDKNFMKILSI